MKSRPHYISIDRLTNEIVDIPADKVRIPNKIGQTNLSREEQDILRAGLPLPKEVMLSNGRKFQALLQVNADKRDVEFVPGQPRQQQSQRQGNGQGKAQDNPIRPNSHKVKKMGITSNAVTARGQTRTGASAPSRNGKTMCLPTSR